MPKKSYQGEKVFYEVSVGEWGAHASFNDYAYVNLFDKDPFAESIYIVLKGKIQFTTSKKIKKGRTAEIVLHPNNYWYEKNIPTDDLSIGDIIIVKDQYKARGEGRVLARISVPTAFYELIRTSLSYEAKGSVTLAGTDLFRSRGEIRHISFSS